MKSSPIGFPKPVRVKLTPIEKAQKLWGKRKVALLLTKGMRVIKKELKQARKKRIKLPSTRKLTLKADQLFSIFIRSRDKKCVLCGSFQNLTCGHLIKRGKRSVRWDEINCHCLCSGCNWKDNFDHDVYVVWFIKNYGQLPYLDLVEKSRGVFKPSRDYLNSIIEKYANKG